MYLLYNFLLGLGFVILLPKFLLDAWRHGKYVAGLRERLGSLQQVKSAAGPVLWLHCVSVGETQAARPLLQAIHRQFPHFRIVVSTVTVTGQQVAREVFKDEAEKIFYFPLDWRWTVRRALRAIDPAVVLIMETELWPNFLRECRRRSVPVAIVNGRLSEQSCRRYQLVPSFVSQVVSCLALAIMQTEVDGQRMRTLGLEPKRVLVSGNLKFDAGTASEQSALSKEFVSRFGLGNGAVLLAASTHEPEERIILAAFRNLSNQAGSKLIVAPRHPERFAEVASLVNASGFRWARRTAQPSGADADCRVILLDTIGELRAVFPISTVVFVGGSIAPVGGHNILEPAAVGACIVTGPHTRNFHEIITAFTAAKALLQVPEMPDNQMIEAVTKVFEELLNDPQRRVTMGERARDLVSENRGATARTIGFLEKIFDDATQPGNQTNAVLQEKAQSA